MITLSAYWLILLPMPWIIWFLVPPSQKKPQEALPFPAFDALYPTLAKRQTRHTYPPIFYWFTLYWILTIFALMSPKWIGDFITEPKQGRHIFLVLDISGSMELPDMIVNHQPITRLQVVKAAAKQFVQARTQDKLGLILFGSVAYLQTPLTTDHNNILKRIQDATVGLAGKTTSIGDAIGLAVKKLQHTPPTGRVMILLTDGANNSGLLSPLKAAALAKSEHIKIYTIGLSAENPYQPMAHLFINMQAGSDLDEDTLKKIAARTGGLYFRASDLKSLSAIYHQIDQLEAHQHPPQTHRPELPFYPWILLMMAFMMFTYIIQRVIR